MDTFWVNAGFLEGVGKMNKFKKNIAFRSISSLVLLIIIVFGVASSIGYVWFTRIQMSHFEDDAFRVADIAALGIDPNMIDEYLESGGESEDYIQTWTNFDLLCNASRSTFIYVILPDRTDYGVITFLFSTINQESPYEVYDFGYVRQTTNDDYREKYRRLCEEGSRREVVVRNTGFIETGAHITAMVPLIDNDGETTAILCVQRQMDSFNESRQGYVKTVAGAMILLIIVIIIGQIFYIYRKLLMPIRTITDEAIRFNHDHAQPQKTLSEKIKNRDEIGILALSIDQLENEIVSFIAEQNRITAEKERSRTELYMAKEIQRSQLPMVFPPYPDRKEFDIFASMDPAREVGGDFYDFFLIDEDHLALVIADVSGKGIPAALFMMVSKMLIKNRLMDGDSPGEALESVNDQLLSENSIDMFVTVWAAVLEISTGNGTACNAGHEHPAIKRAGKKYALTVYRHLPVVGAIENIHYRDHAFHLDPGDSLFVYTDGVAEAVDEENNLFGTDRMLEVLNRDTEEAPAAALKSVKSAIDSFAAGTEQFDDITMLCLRYNGPSNEKG